MKHCGIGLRTQNSTGGSFGKRTAERALQNHFWRRQKLGLVWSVPLSSKENDRESSKRGGGAYRRWGGPKTFLGRDFTVCSPPPPPSFPPPLLLAKVPQNSGEPFGARTRLLRTGFYPSPWAPPERSYSFFCFQMIPIHNRNQNHSSRSRVLVSVIVILGPRLR